MTEARFQLQLTGRLRPGSDRDSAVRLLARLLRITEDRARELLQGEKRSVNAPLTRDQAEQVRRHLEDAGIEYRILRKKAELELEPIDAPSPPAEPIVAAAGRKTAGSGKEFRAPAGRTRDEGQGRHLLLLDRIFKLGFALLTIVAVLAYLNKDALPDPSFYDLSRLGEPIQTDTALKPFKTTAKGIEYTINPLFDYDLRAVVVSQYVSDSLGDIYHHDKWKDFINIKDLCVIWGDNVAGAVYQEMHFDNSPWICWAYWPSQEVGSRFAGHQLSNNHLLTNDPVINQAIMEAEPGDQIHLKGVLASYSHSNNSFTRGTSVSRTDTGNGACETIFVTDFVIERKANSGWRRLYAVTGTGAALSLTGALVMLFMAPVRRRV